MSLWSESGLGGIEPSLLYAETVSASPLTFLQIGGEFSDASTLHVTLFFAKYFPNVELIEVPHNGSQLQWDKVLARLKFWRQVVCAMRISVRTAK